MVAFIPDQWNTSSILQFAPRLFSSFLLVTWISSIFFMYGFSQELIVGLMVWLILVSTTLIALKNEIIGGCLFTVFGIAFVIVIMGKGADPSYIAVSSPLFIIGLLFLASYLYEEHIQASRVEM